MSTFTSAENGSVHTRGSSKDLYALVGAFIVAGVLSGCAVFPKSFNGGADKLVTADVQSRFAEHAELQAPNLLYVQTVNGVVYLSGTVSTDLQRRNAETVALEARNVARVVNSISVSNG